MIQNIVDLYVSDRLRPRLKGSNLSENQMQVIIDDISSRLESLLSVWHDKEYIDTLFELVKEEALFYKPKSQIQIRAFVVIGIRNSVIEDLHSSAPYNTLLKTEEDHIARSSAFIQEITSDAISFFKEKLKRNDNFSAIYENTRFKELDAQYPRAWELLKSMKSSKTLHQPFESVVTPVILKQVRSFTARSERNITSTLSGIDPTIDDGLLNQLKHVSDNSDNAVFFVPSFKHISRNLLKVLKVLDFLVYAKVTIVTPNYLFTPEKIAVRNQLLKPIHSNTELHAVLINTHGVNKEHANALKDIAGQV